MPIRDVRNIIITLTISVDNPTASEILSVKHIYILALQKYTDTFFHAISRWQKNIPTYFIYIYNI